MRMRNSPGIAIRGIGWVTPLGNGLEETWQRLMAGECAAVAEMPPVPCGGGKRFYIPVPPKQVESLGRAPRIRRSGAITYFTVAAGLAALENAGIGFGQGERGGGLEPAAASRTAVISAICSGGVNYTRRFYEKVVAEGPASASPILFPETVYNAPASHLSALLGIDGASYTLVGDSTVGLSALLLAEELLACDPALEQCVVVGAEECDWILWEGYTAWKWVAGEPCVRPHEEPPRGMLLAEGAAALVVGRPGENPDSCGEEIRLEVNAVPFTRRAGAGAALDAALGALPTAGAQWAVGSANGTWIDRIEAAGLRRHLPGVPAWYPKAVLGDPLGASALMQVAFGAMALVQGQAPGSGAGFAAPLRKVALSALGLNHQAAGAVLAKGLADSR